MPRVDLKVNEDYVNRYYSGDVNKDYLEFRKNTDFVWSASHGPIIRGMQSPVCSSYITALTDEHIDQAEAYLGRFVDRWFRMYDDAPRLIRQSSEPPSRSTISPTGNTPTVRTR